MKRALATVILFSLVALPAFVSGCTLAVSQTREAYTYSSEVYDAAKDAPASEQEVLNFLAEDTTDQNLWTEGVYECGHFAADLWWNAYTQGLEACIVWVKHWQQGVEQVHWVVKFCIENENQNHWLWVEPSTDEVVDESDYTVQDTYCEEQALNICRSWWAASSTS